MEIWMKKRVTSYQFLFQRRKHEQWGVATYTQKRKCERIWTKIMGKFYHSSDGFLILRAQNVCVEAILISLNPILTKYRMIL